jgi:hypothetical protein
MAGVEYFGDKAARNLCPPTCAFDCLDDEGNICSTLRGALLTLPDEGGGGDQIPPRVA